MAQPARDPHEPPVPAAPVARSTYRYRVVMKLVELGFRAPLSAHDEQTVLMGIKYGVGPIDCAYQIAADANNEIEHAEHMADVKRTRERLDQLKVAELRVLHVHYFAHPKLAAELNKQCLIDELVEPIMGEDR